MKRKLPALHFLRRQYIFLANQTDIHNFGGGPHKIRQAPNLRRVFVGDLYFVNWALCETIISPSQQAIKKDAAKTAEEAVEFARSSPHPPPADLYAHILVEQNEVVRGCDPFTSSHSSQLYADRQTAPFIPLQIKLTELFLDLYYITHTVISWCTENNILYYTATIVNIYFCHALS